MAIVKLPDRLINDMQSLADKHSRSVEVQIEHLLTVGYLCQINPDITYRQIVQSQKTINENKLKE